MSLKISTKLAIYTLPNVYNRVVNQLKSSPNSRYTPSTLTLADLAELAVLYFDLRPEKNMPLQNNAPEGSDTFQWPVIERDRVGGFG